MPLGKNQRFQALSLPSNIAKGKICPAVESPSLRVLGLQVPFLPLLLDRGEGRGEESTSLRNPQSAIEYAIGLSEHMVCATALSCYFPCCMKRAGTSRRPAAAAQKLIRET